MVPVNRSIQILSMAAVLSLQGCASIKQAVRYARHTDPLTVQEHLTLGASYERQALTNEAEKEYRAAIHQDQKNVEAHMALGTFLYGQNRYPEAEKILRRAQRLDS